MQVYRVLLGFSKCFLVTRRLRTWACSLRMTILVLQVMFFVFDPMRCDWLFSYISWTAPDACLTGFDRHYPIYFTKCFCILVFFFPFIRLFVHLFLHVLIRFMYSLHVVILCARYVKSLIPVQRILISESLVKVCHHRLSFPSHKTINNIQSDIRLLMTIYNIVQKF